MDDSIKIWKGGVPGYSLIDSGKGEKLEEINKVRIKRKEPRAWWNRSLPDENWRGTKDVLDTVLTLPQDIKCSIKYKQSSKHIGIFPEQSAEWKYIGEQISNFKTQNPNQEIHVLNLFGYTGIASLYAAKAGSHVTHVDASKQSVDWAKENQKLSGLETAPIRWIVDDAVKFLKREAKRNVKYDAIIMDPPSYGKGPKGEVWKIEEELPKLLKVCREVLSDNPLFVIVNMYSTDLSSLSIHNMLQDMARGKEDDINPGELVIPQANGKLMPMSIFAIWAK